MALQLFSDDVLEHVLIQGSVGNEILQLRIIGPERSQAAKLRGATSAVFLLPVVEGGLEDAHLVADLLDLHAGLVLAKRDDDLRLGELALLYGNRSCFFKIARLPDFLV